MLSDYCQLGASNCDHVTVNGPCLSIAWFRFPAKTNPVGAGTGTRSISISVLAIFTSGIDTFHFTFVVSTAVGLYTN